jgi:hypothetical protein
MKEYCYVLVRNDGSSYLLPENQSEQQALYTDMARLFVLPRLLREGWKPVRETPMGKYEFRGFLRRYCFSFDLVLLERDDSSSAIRPSG